MTKFKSIKLSFSGNSLYCTVGEEPKTIYYSTDLPQAISRFKTKYALVNKWIGATIKISKRRLQSGISG